MEKIKIYSLLLAVIAVGSFSSCNQELDLDETTLLQLEKQEKMKELDALFDLAFIDPVKASDDYDRYVKEELLRDGQNFLMDNDVRIQNTFTDLAIRLNMKFEKVKGEVSTTSLFDIYKAKFEIALFNKTLMGDIPQQVGKNQKLDKFENRVAEINQFYEAKVRDFKAKNTIDSQVLQKQWQYSTWVFKPDFSAIYVVNFDFKLKSDGSMDIEQFFLIPTITMKGVWSLEESSQFKEDIEPSLLAPVEFMTYGNKILFFFHIAYDPHPGSTKFNRQYVYEFDYSVEDNQLTLSNPHIMLYMHPFLYVTGYGEPNYELNYFEAWRESIPLTAN
ncbi:hypothetical protein [Proteiniphilum sp.]|uniref:hypothetical protein n=1 Tax=Proteiniphilum sp. TaxID=1926877 RepID=UPI002B1F235C|nr:hypothetical protein [Proteiniphilum sp.]MEA4917392.1 hypothetical protein [Proteiniphilum sp.]